MFGKHHVIVESKRLKYEFDIKRNITVILGDSATGKTTLVDMLSNYSRYSTSAGVRVESDVPVVVYSGDSELWEDTLKLIQDSIVFIDEDYSFVFKKAFAETVQNSSNYFVIITRRPLHNLPYSINEVYGIRTTGKYHYPEKIYHEFYSVYSDIDNSDIASDKYTFLLEDSKSGYEFYRNAFGYEVCRSCEGNANISGVLSDEQVDNAVVIADGAAFGAYIEDLLAVAESKQNVLIYLPESFEWLVLKSGIIKDDNVSDIIEAPENYIKSEEYFSWERFFTALLIHLTENDPVTHYSKIKLLPFYYSGKNKDAILDVLPPELSSLKKEG